MDEMKAEVVKDLDDLFFMHANVLRLSVWEVEIADSNGVVDHPTVNPHVDLLLFTIAEAGKRGMYVHLTPMQTTWSATDEKAGTFSRRINQKAFVLAMDEVDQVSGKTLKELQLGYIKNLLELDNPYNNKKLKDDPTIGLIEPVNEQSLWGYYQFSNWKKGECKGVTWTNRDERCPVDGLILPWGDNGTSKSLELVDAAYTKFLESAGTSVVTTPAVTCEVSDAGVSSSFSAFFFEGITSSAQVASSLYGKFEVYMDGILVKKGYGSKTGTIKKCTDRAAANPSSLVVCKFNGVTVFTSTPSVQPQNPQLDVCSNIEGAQATIPSGYVLDTANTCVLVSTAETSVPTTTLPSNPVVTPSCIPSPAVTTTVPATDSLDTYALFVQTRTKAYAEYMHSELRKLGICDSASVCKPVAMSLFPQTLSQDVSQARYPYLEKKIADAYKNGISDSPVEATTFGWYPNGQYYEINSDGTNALSDTLPEDKYLIKGKGPVVYEYGISGAQKKVYLEPAAARKFRSMGVQIATRFQYDSRATAPLNGLDWGWGGPTYDEWPMEWLNLYHTPAHALAFIEAAKVFWTTPLNMRNASTWSLGADEHKFDVAAVSYSKNQAIYKDDWSHLMVGDTPDWNPLPVEPTKIEDMSCVGHECKYWWAQYWLGQDERPGVVSIRKYGNALYLKVLPKVITRMQPCASHGNKSGPCAAAQGKKIDTLENAKGIIPTTELKSNWVTLSFKEAFPFFSALGSVIYYQDVATGEWRVYQHAIESDSAQRTKNVVLWPDINYKIELP